MATIQKSTLTFLKKLEKNNNRPWFQENKAAYDVAHANAKEFMAALLAEMNKADKIEKSKMFRIYRDVRFSKDKTPYNPAFRISLGREKPYLRGGYYLSIGPKEGYVAGGFFNPNPHDLKLIRENIAIDAKPFRKIFKAKKFVDTFGSIYGDGVKSAPKGFDKAHPDIDLIKLKQHLVSKRYTIKEVTDPKFVKTVVKDYKVMRPWFDFMGEVLGHNLNGEPLY
jgi:uncharacterized protein (TIGR02453 family)